MNGIGEPIYADEKKRKSSERPVIEDVEAVDIGDGGEPRMVYIGSRLSSIERQWLVQMQKKNHPRDEAISEYKRVEMKGLQGRLAYIRRFISNLSGRCRPFSKRIKKGVHFVRLGRGL